MLQSSVERSFLALIIKKLRANRASELKSDVIYATVYIKCCTAKTGNIERREGKRKTRREVKIRRLKEEDGGKKTNGRIRMEDLKKERGNCRKGKEPFRGTFEIFNVIFTVPYREQCVR